MNRIAVVVPAHDESRLLPACLAALRAALAAVPAQLIVVADDCADDTADLARRAGATVLTVAARNVGLARATGMAYALERGATWLATTDADSRVPADWLAWHTRHAGAGTEVLAGEVRVADWSPHPWRVRDRYERRYRVGGGHVHGANLGCTARSYQALGGFGHLAVGEDQDLVDRAHLAGHRVVHDADTPVVTSARRTARAPAGFATYLEGLRNA